MSNLNSDVLEIQKELASFLAIVKCLRTCALQVFTFRHVKGLFFGLLREEAFLELADRGYRCQIAREMLLTSAQNIKDLA